MPKLKTKHAVAKRFKKLASGQLKRKQARRQHRAWGKSTKQRRQLAKSGLVHSTDLSRIVDLIQH
jgi:large subunit ribosomal protein L35